MSTDLRLFRRLARDLYRLEEEVANARTLEDARMFVTDLARHCREQMTKAEVEALKP